MEITFRPTTRNDFEFLWRLHVASMREYVEKTFDWDEDLQRGYISKASDGEVGMILLVDGVDAGFWYVIESDVDIFLSSVLLLPEYQNRGIGTKLINELKSSDKPVRLQVLKVNPARALYERLGFQVCGDEGTHYDMICPASDSL